MRTFRRMTIATMTLCGLTMLAPVQAGAVSDIHCFSKKTQIEYEQEVSIFDVLGVDESQLTDAQRIEMLEEYDRNGWTLRLVEMPWLDMKYRYGRQSRVGKRLVFSAGNFHWLDALTMMAIEHHAEHMSRRTGSRHIYVSPQMKRMARERDVTRRLMRKKCHANIAYLD